jgi:hypothetical protein
MTIPPKQNKTNKNKIKQNQIQNSLGDSDVQSSVGVSDWANLILTASLCNWCVLPALYRWGNSGTKDRFSHLPKVTHLVTVRARNLTRPTDWSRAMLSITTLYNKSPPPSSSSSVFSPLPDDDALIISWAFQSPNWSSYFSPRPSNSALSNRIVIWAVAQL